MWTEEMRRKSVEKVKKNALSRNINGQSSKLLSNSALKNILHTSGRPYECSMCGINEWQGHKLSLDLDHIDGDTFNNDLENLRYLCPNCHSTTPTYRGRNINTGKIKVSNEELLTALNECSNIRQALIRVGLSPRGANYARATKLLAGVDK
jgi:5-methylcytosine-specific restriction endonuclease McrA